jgi:hypothetical protein
MATYQRNGEVSATMFQPGKETNIPTSSGAPMGFKAPDWTGNKLFQVDGVTVTIGLLILIVAVFWLFMMFSKKR